MAVKFYNSKDLKDSKPLEAIDASGGVIVPPSDIDALKAEIKAEMQAEIDEVKANQQKLDEDLNALVGVTP